MFFLEWGDREDAGEVNKIHLPSRKPLLLLPFTLLWKDGKMNIRYTVINIYTLLFMGGGESVGTESNDIIPSPQSMLNSLKPPVGKGLRLGSVIQLYLPTPPHPVHLHSKQH